MTIERMWKRFSSKKGQPELTEEPSACAIGDPSGELLLDSAESIQQHIITMAGQARHRILIFSPTLTHRIYDSSELVEAISVGIREFHKLQVKIIICNPQPCVARHHRLVELAQQLSSFIDIRRAHDDYRNIIQDYVIADERAYIRRPNFERFTAEADYNNPSKAHNDAEYFTEIWEQSERETEFLQLHL